MRDRINRRLPRARRRALLAAFISISYGGSIASAEGPVTPRRLPPLPLESTGAMRQNPFCEPVTADALRLVSGSDEGRTGDAKNGPLRPLRERVGLAPIRVAFGDNAPTAGSRPTVERESESDLISGSSGAPRRVEATSSSVTPDPVQRNPYTGSSDDNEAPEGGVRMSLGDVGSVEPAPPARVAEVPPEPTSPHAVSLGRSARVLKVPEVADMTVVADMTGVQEATETADVGEVADTAKVVDTAKAADAGEVVDTGEVADSTPSVPMISEAAPMRLSRDPDQDSDRMRRGTESVASKPVAMEDPAETAVQYRVSDHGDRSEIGLTLPPLDDSFEETATSPAPSPVAVIEAVAPRLRSVDAVKPQLGRPPRVVRPPVRMTLVDRSGETKSLEPLDDDSAGPVRSRLAAESSTEVVPTSATPEPVPESVPVAAQVRDSTETPSLQENGDINEGQGNERRDDRERGQHRVYGRPPVAVGATPVAFERGDTEGVVSIVRPTVEPRNRVVGGSSRTNSISTARHRTTGAESRSGIPERSGLASTDARTTAGESDTDFQAAAFEVPADTPETRLMMEKAEVRSLTLELPVRRFHVDDTETCQVLRSGGNRLKLIGTGSGTTRLVVWVAENGDDAKSKPAMVFHVDVRETLDASGNDVADLTERLNDSIRLVFPSSDVRIDRQGDRLVVRGGCADERTATAILRMVRRSCLMPVEDAITVR